MLLSAEWFQSHERLSLDLRGWLVCITGPNNVGKSAVIRLARWVMYDALRGSKFIKKGHDLARATIEVDGRVVSRTKSRKTSERNAYEVDGRALESIGTGTPPEVQEALGIRRAVIDKDLELELNVVGQKEHPFLMEETGTAKSKILNALTGLHVLDVAMRQTSALVRSLRGQEKALGEQRSALEAELGGFSDLPAKEAAVAAARAEVELLAARESKAREGRRDLEELSSRRSALSALTSRPQPDMGAVEAMSARMDELVTRATSARADLASLAEARASLDRLRAHGLNRVNADLMEADLARQDALQAKASLLREALRDRTVLKVMGGELRAFQANLDSALDQLRAMAGVPCGECGRPLEESCLEAAA